ncbi:MAG TPA: hypothetical protein VLX31_17855 [Streptosporangiaceae bacterium]|nr:hypothetical protein [Streptosporangiaceae bacterium]
MSVTHQVAVPPVPIATGIRVGTHADCKFDRLVIDFNGAVPGYTVSFVTQVIQDPSGKTITMPGSRFLVIKFSPAQGHDASGQPTLPTTVLTVGYPMLKSYDVAGDFEGVLTIALGLARNTMYRVGELTGEVYIDVAWSGS